MLYWYPCTTTLRAVTIDSTAQLQRLQVNLYFRVNSLLSLQSSMSWFSNPVMVHQYSIHRLYIYEIHPLAVLAVRHNTNQALAVDSRDR